MLFGARKARKEVSDWLSTRDPLTPEDWRQFYPGQSKACADAVKFIIDFFGGCSGLDARFLRPTDRLGEDLRFDQLCYGDWDLDFYEEFKARFGRDFEKSLVPEGATTVQDWIHSVTRALE